LRIKSEHRHSVSVIDTVNKMGKKKKKKAVGIDQETEEMLRHVMVRRRKELSIRGGGPTGIGNPLREVIARRKIGRLLQSQELDQLWTEAVEPQIAKQTKVVSLRNRVLMINVSDSVLISELANFHKQQILKTIQQKRPDIEIKNIKFKLNAGLKKK